MKTKNKNIFLILSLLIFAACGSKDSIRVNNGNPRKVNNTSNSIVSSYLAGDGSINDPFLIQNIEHLQNITRNIQDWDKNFKLVEDINAQGVIMEPIGIYNFETGEEISFRGSFDGQGHTINNLAIDQSDRKLATALFASTDGAIIQNLNLENVQINSESFAGALIGNSKNTDIVGISLTGNVECMDATGTHCGGVVGNYITEGEINTVSNITTDVTVTGTDLIAGFIAKVKAKDAASLNIQNINTSSVVSSGIETSEAAKGNTFGGLIGHLSAENASEVLIENIDLTSDVSITTKGSFSAVFIGTILSKAGFERAGPSTIQILKARSNGDISSPAAQNENQGFIGGKAGIIGSFDESSIEIKQSSYEGNVSVTSGATNRSGIGGFIGIISTNSENVLIEDSYVNSIINIDPSVENADHLGLFIGRANSPGLTVSRNYALGNIIANSTRSNIGVFTGSALIDTVFLNNYVNLETCTLSDRKIGNLQTDGVTDLSKAELTVQTSFQNWDFNEIWQLREDSNAPTLRK